MYKNVFTVAKYSYQKPVLKVSIAPKRRPILVLRWLLLLNAMVNLTFSSLVFLNLINIIIKILKYSLIL